MKFLLPLALVIAISFGGCSTKEKTKPPGRVLIIGIDGASPLVAGPLMSIGLLPNLSTLAQQGIYGPLRSVLPLYSPRIWNTIATGKTPKKHGILSFVKPNPNKQKKTQELYLSDDRKVPTLWNIASEAGLSVAVVNWWTTYPPEIINGVMISDHFFPGQIAGIKKTFNDQRPSSGALIYPESWLGEARTLLEDKTPLSSISNPFNKNAALPDWVNQELLFSQYESDQRVTRIALGVQKEIHPDLMMVFMPGIDRVSHWLWGNLEPASKYPENLRPSPKERQAGRDALEDYYLFTDQLIGLLMQDYGPDDLILVISDHGFEAGVSMMLLTGGHESHLSLDGVLFARGHGIPKGQPAGPVSVFNLVPTVLAWLGLPVANDMKTGPAKFLSTKNISQIQSYDNLTIERMNVGASGNEEEMVEHLRALGYLEEPDTTMPEKSTSP